jgi:MGT family glycosyltransferase
MARADRLLVASIAHFDRPVPVGRLRPIYVGPVSGRWRPQAGSVAVQPARGRLRVLISYSTETLQNSPQRVQTALDALAGLPLDVIATTSGAFNAGRLRVPGNATVLDYLPHDSVMAAVELMVCHGGHGTTMAALSCGVPLVCVPGLGRDQAPIAARVSELGLGIALDSDARTGTIRDAVVAIFADHRYRSRAREFAHRTGQPDGTSHAAIEILAMLDEAV